LLDRVRRNAREIVEATDVAGLEAGRSPVPLEERNLPAALHRREETLLLPGADLVAREAEHLAEVVRRRRELARERFVVERAEQPGDVAFVAGRVHGQITAARRPPSTWNTEPVMYPPHGDARNATRPAISSGAPMRPI